MMASPVSSPTTVYRFGTSGYRDNSEAGFSPDVVRQITEAIADELVDQMMRNQQAFPVLLGGDTRAKTAMALPIIRGVLAERGLDVLEVQGDVATPVLAYAAAALPTFDSQKRRSAGAILLTASHNPWDYGGFNFLTPEGAVAPSSLTKKFEHWQANPAHHKLNRAKLGLPAQPSHQWLDPYPAYKAHLQSSLKLRFDAMQQAGLAIFYDPLYATGRHIFPRLLQEAAQLSVDVIHGEDTRPEDYDGLPEPSAENLAELTQRVQASQQPLTLGFSNDGDSDRFGVLDETGTYLHPNQILNLILYHLVKNRRMNGLVVRSQATTHWLDAYAAQHGLTVRQTPVGYKYIAETFLEEVVLLGGESSGGLSMGGHIPEKDGLLANLLIAELVAVEKKPLSVLLKDVTAAVPQCFAFREWTIHTTEKAAILAAFQQWSTGTSSDALGGFTVDARATEQAAEQLKQTYGTQDGVKLYFAQQAGWMLMRASGTEPLVRIYFEVAAASPQEAETRRQALQDWMQAQLISRFGVAPGTIKLKA